MRRLERRRVRLVQDYGMIWVGLVGRLRLLLLDVFLVGGARLWVEVGR
jgi:hypothetical protein